MLEAFNIGIRKHPIDLPKNNRSKNIHMPQQEISRGGLWDTARNNLIRANALDRADAQISKKTARDNLVVTAKVPTPKRKRGK